LCAIGSALTNGNYDLIFIQATKEECLELLEVDEVRKYRKDEWRGYIDKWFETYIA